jgi:hypothetical protein
MIDHRKFLKMDDKDIDINSILSSINEIKAPVWPFVGEEYANVVWVAAEQPQTHVQVSIHYTSMQAWYICCNCMCQ